MPIVSANPPSWMVSVNVPAWKLLQMIIKQVVASTCLPIAVTMKDFPGIRERTVDINSSDYHIERYQTLVLKCYRCALSFQRHIFHMDISRADFHPWLWRVYFSHLSWQFRQQFGFFSPLKKKQYYEDFPARFTRILVLNQFLSLSSPYVKTWIINQDFPSTISWNYGTGKTQKYSYRISNNMAAIHIQSCGKSHAEILFHN